MPNAIYYILPMILLSCAPKKPDPKNDKHDGSAPVLILNDETISLNEFNRRIESLPDFAKSRLGTIEAKRVHLTGVAQFEVLAKYAAKIGLEKDPEVISALKTALQKSLRQPPVELTNEEIEQEMKRRKTEIRFGLLLNNADCFLQKELLSIKPAKRLDRIKAEVGIVSFSTRIKDDNLVSDQGTLEGLFVVGDHKMKKDKGERCRVVMLTKIETFNADRVNVENDLRAQKREAFLETLEK